MPRSDRPAYTAQVSALLARADQSVRAGRPADALLPLQQAAAAHPFNAAIQYDLGSVYLQTGRLADAVTAFHLALAANPRFAQASLRLGIALQAQGDEAAAITAYRHATTLLPSLAEARFRVGALLETHGHRAEAIAAFRRAAASAPKTGLGRLSNARALLAEGRDEEAERALRQLLVLEPDNAVATDMLGTVLANAGHLEEACACYERATAAAPHLAGSYYDLVRCRRITQDDADLVARMRIAVAAPELHPEVRLKVHLALGKVADDLGDPAAAMRHFDAADTLRGGLGSFDLTAIEARVNRLIASFTPDLVAQAAESGRDDATPVLILGLPRSGTTLVEQILSCHPDVHAGGELPFWTERGLLWEQTGLPGGESSFLARTASDYTRMLHALAPKAARITDKMPLNVFWAGLIHMTLPRATIIHCRRSPIDTALSIHRTYFNQHVAFPTGGAGLVGAVRAIERLTAHWRAVLPGDRFFELEYEQLARDPEGAIRRLVAACGLPWESACLRPEQNPRIVKTPSKWQVRQPIAPTSIEHWRRYEPWLGALAALAPCPA
jgi:tetratricopeptide (TPR) repeat protein